MNQIYFGDCRQTMQQLIEQGTKVQMCVTSPPYFGLRDYGVNGQLGLEDTIDEYIQNMVEVFRLVRELLHDDGTLWLNLGDSYAGSGRGMTRTGLNDGKNPKTKGLILPKQNASQSNLKPKDLIGIPWRVAFALQADGWYLRQDIIWHKPNPMPESITDRCTKAHEYIFLFSKSRRYYFDHEAIKEPVAESSLKRLSQDLEEQGGSHIAVGKHNGTMKAVCSRSSRDNFKRKNSKRAAVIPNQSTGTHRLQRPDSEYDLLTRNKRSVWQVATKPYKGAHFATFPPDLIEPCILAGSRVNDVVFDPFMGSGTTAATALKHDRNYLGCELNPDYEHLQKLRIEKICGVSA
ncbi:site-specific DNA-methyltransferase [Acinetobacter puyangensis]|uniref:Methyltransferase n=1 Tax=Acinetobacter puyangensis TaxID=1096779 RepID=A0A240E611_9GAMM|nr:site-specific DNA-methyltransferase [Acinetobacter puyangensis]SNX44194.1 DNA modification methylase [Acinetobacter puyangensis]